MRGVSGWVPVVVLTGLWAFGALAADSPPAAQRTASTEASASPQQSAGDSLRTADFLGETPSPEAREVANWVVRSADNRTLPFIVIDKVQARVYVFHTDGRLRGAAPALMGLAIGDNTVPGIGQRPLSSIKPQERTTPAGRFMASLDRDIHGVEVLWVDYDSSLSLHKVVKGTPKERRAERLASPNPAERRITFGCINVPVPFYERVVSPALKGTYGVVYILPETRPARDLFGTQAGLQPVRATANETAALR